MKDVDPTIVTNSTVTINQSQHPPADLFNRIYINFINDILLALPNPAQRLPDRAYFKLIAQKLIVKTFRRFLPPMFVASFQN